MIEQFSHIFIGDVIDGDRIGLQGVPAQDRWYAPERFSQAYTDARETAILLESLGFDFMWLAEHHFQREGYECIPNVLMLSLWLAQHTQHIRFGCAFNIVPMWHPVRLAEDFATVDILTGGRVTFGVGRGYHTREVETFGSPVTDRKGNRELFNEQVEVILKAFHEESFCHRGKHFTIPPEVPYRGYKLQNVTVVPRPQTRPVEVWQPIVSGDRDGIDFMAKHGIKGMVVGADQERLDRIIHEFQAANARYGRNLQLGQDLIIGFWWFLGETAEDARRRVRPSFEENAKFSGPLGLDGYGNDKIRALGPAAAEHYIASRADFDKAISRGSWVVGTPTDLIGHIRDLERNYPGLRHITLSRPTGLPLNELHAQLSHFAQDVMPAFR